MAAKKGDTRGPVAVLAHTHSGPDVWFPRTFGTPERRIAQGLRSAARIVTNHPGFAYSVQVQERGEWVPA